MSQSQPLDGFLNSVFSDPSLTETLSESDRTALQTMFGDLCAGIEQQMHLATAVSMASDQPETELIDGFWEQKQLQEYNDATLVERLGGHVDHASGIVGVLSSRPISKQNLAVVSRIELQLTAITLSVSDLRQTLQSQQETVSPQKGQAWQQSLKQFLLREFDFINFWLR